MLLNYSSTSATELMAMKSTCKNLLVFPDWCVYSNYYCYWHFTMFSLFITSPPYWLVLFCSLTSVVCHRL